MKNSEDVSALASASRCAGGEFDVKWVGSISINDTMVIYGGTVLTITGSSNAVIDGGSTHKFLNTLGGEIHLSGLQVQNCFSEFGGAISAQESVITIHDTNFTGCSADQDGGAIYLLTDNDLSWSGRTGFYNNSAGRDGGAISVRSSSNISWEGETRFIGNQAIDGGSIIIGSSSSAYWEGDTIFSQNTAIGEYPLGNGGAFYVWGNSVVVWDGKTIFSDNSANHLGGVFYLIPTSFVSWNGDTLFSTNTANYGGGVFSMFRSTVSWDGKTVFYNNSAYLDGGVFDALFETVISWKGDTTFEGNSAGLTGGAVKSTAIVSWEGNTNFTNNYARDSGGAIQMQGVGYDEDNPLFETGNGYLSWSGTTVFSGNTGDSTTSSGGALSIVYTNCLWDGETIFSNNTVRFLGGAISILNSNVTWGGDNIFSDNIASSLDGGAISVRESSVSWDGKLLMSGNSARSRGGAIAIGDSSDVSWSGDSVFTNNTCGQDGGAIALVGDSSMSWSDVSSFSKNSCGGSGGAIALFGDVSFSPGESSSFEENEALTLGGAVAMSGVGTGPIFSKASFVSNKSPLGGAVYSSSSGTTRKSLTSSLVLQVSYDRCSFVNNTGSTSGGAVESVAGTDIFYGSVFAGNFAPIGGGLRLGGSATIIYCGFFDNKSGEDGGVAVSNLGVFAISESQFSGNVFSCDSGKYLDSIDGNMYGSICDGCDECSDCIFEEEDIEPVCLEQLPNTYSDGGNATVASLDIEPGYWRATSESLVILECYNEDACGGGITGEPLECLDGYEGPYCSICSDGYSTTLSFTCEECLESDVGAVLVASVIMVSIVAVVLLFKYLVSGEIDVKKQSLVHKALKRLPLQSIKILIVVWQILTQFTSIANVTYPDVYQKFLDSVNVLNFDALWIPSVGCIIDVDFHDRLLVATILPLAVLLLLLATFTIAKRMNKGSGESLEKVRERHMSVILLVSFLVYSSVSSTIFQAFACEELDDGKDYLRVDYRIECDSSKHEAFQIFAGIMIFVYPIGIPAFYAFLLYKNREVLKDGEERESNIDVQPVDGLWRPYKPERFYYEVIECLRRIMLTGIIVFIYPNTAAQVAVTLALAFVFVVVSERFSPYISKWDSRMSLTGHIIVFTSMYVALLGKVDVSGERSGSQDVFSAILVASHVCMVIVIIVETVFICLSVRDDKGKDADITVPSPSGYGMSIGPVEIIGPVKDHSRFFFSEEEPI